MKTNSISACLAGHTQSVARAWRLLLPRRASLAAVMVAMAALAFEPQPAQAAVTEAWVHRYSSMVSSAFDHAPKVVSDVAGDIIVTGTTGNDSDAISRDMLTIKYSGADGSILWQQRYNGPANSYDSPSSAGVDHSGNVVVAGSSHNSVPCWCYNDVDYYMAKYAAADGALLWEKRYSGPGNYSDQATAVASDGSGNVVVTGNFYDNGVSGYTAKYSGADGALLWEKLVPGRGGAAVGVDGNGNVVVAGTYTAKYAAADGALLWEHQNGPTNSHAVATAVAVDASGNIVVTGNSRNESNLDYYTAKYAAADGALLWEQRYNGPANRDDIPSALGVDASGNVVVTGQSQNGEAYKDNDYYTVKYAVTDGALLWEKRYNGPANREDGAWAVAVDGSGNVIVTGHSQNSETDNENDNDYYTVKYAAADGALLWEKRYNGPANGPDSGTSLALCPNGMVAVTGSSSGDYATVVYRETLPPVFIELIPAGVRLRFTGVPSSSYTMQRAPAVIGPWSTINTQTAPASGLLEYLDTTPHPGSGFYRTVQP